MSRNAELNQLVAWGSVLCDSIGYVTAAHETERREINPKQILFDGHVLSAKESVQRNWSRIQDIAKEEYASKLLDLHHQTDSEVVSHLRLVCRNEIAKTWFAVVEPIAFDHCVIARLLSKETCAIANKRRFYTTSCWRDKESNISTDKDVVLEELEGFVEQIEDDTAFVRLSSEHGDEMFGEYSAAELEQLGIHEGRRFRCVTIEKDGKVRVELAAIPENSVGAAEVKAIEDRLRDALLDNELDGDY